MTKAQFDALMAYIDHIIYIRREQAANPYDTRRQQSLSERSEEAKSMLEEVLVIEDDGK